MSYELALGTWQDNPAPDLTPPRHPWPSGPSEPQAPWEPPRTVTGTVRDRAARLKALGNAVVPQQVFPILAAIVAAEREASHASA